MKVRSWSSFQHYKNRRPPWIKLHRTLLDDYGFMRLPLASQALAPRLWLLASESEDGSLPSDPAELAFRLHAEVRDVIDALKPLIRAGFLEGELDASEPLAERKQGARLETEERKSRDRAQSSVAVAPASWSSEACDDWQARYHGTAPGGRIGKALAPLVKSHGWEAVRSAWRSYLVQAEAEFASPQRFAATYGRWSGLAPPASRTSSLIEANKAVLRDFVGEDDAGKS